MKEKQRAKKFGTLHELACHPCAGAMLIFSVLFQFSICPFGMNGGSDSLYFIRFQGDRSRNLSIGSKSPCSHSVDGFVNLA